VRVFLDTNVLVSAFATRGLCADVMRVVLAEHQLIIGEIVLTELREVLSRRIKLPVATVDDIVALLRAQEVVPKPRKPSDVPIRDPDDRWILASAVAGRADVLVTGDQDLIAVAEAAPLPILDPRGFWNLLTKGS
jgi:putative PIN family toxin of toxin-antitoxin system